MEIKVTNNENFKSAFIQASATDEDVIISVSEGNYNIDSTIEIDRDNIKIKGENNNVTIHGSRKINLAGLKKTNGIIEINLSDFGITNLGQFGEGPYEDFWKVYDIPKPHMTEYGPGLELFYDNKLMPISRYPKEGFIRIKKALGETDMTFKGERSGSREGVFIGDDDNIKNWDSFEEMLLIGYWNVDWATQRHTIKNIDRKTGAITVNEPYHTFGYRDGACFTTEIGGKFYALNVKEAVTEPGQWYIDRKNKMLYLYPYEGQDYVEISCADDMFYSKGHKNISICGFNISQCRKSGICFEECEDITVSDITVENTGAWGILGENCMRMNVDKCTVSLTGGGGIGVNGGDRQSLTSSDNIIQNCTIHDIARWHKTYMAALDISGVGCTLRKNYIYDVPHFGIVFAGNNNIIEYNEINNACYESNDAGAIYSGRNTTYRGNIIRYNYLHDLNGYENLGCVGLYFDDLMSSAEVYSNIFANIPYIGLLLAGGRDFDIHDNFFYNCRMAIMYDKRGMTWGAYENDGGKIGEYLNAIDYKCDIWKKAYPELYNIRENNMLMPLGNSITNNTVIGGDGFCLQTEDIADVTKFENNTFAGISIGGEKEINHADWYYITE